MNPELTGDPADRSDRADRIPASLDRQPGARARRSSGYFFRAGVTGVPPRSRCLQQTRAALDDDLARPHSLPEPLTYLVHDRDLGLLVRETVRAQTLAMQQGPVSGQALVVLPAQVVDERAVEQAGRLPDDRVG
ncbi:hypothetical protein [Sphaerisporangium dianthi]|uniref:Uncharacterized protein n=1 Tax=Sphaerisporangium dianthi TaxID=1436120 RepID=A0ABV9C9J3_9ACTN